MAGPFGVQPSIETFMVALSPYAISARWTSDLKWYDADLPLSCLTALLDMAI
jgi:hypothetical protein